MAISISSLVTALVVHAAAAGTATTPPPTFTHTRAVTGVAAELIATAARVPSILAQLEALERTDVVVYVVPYFTLMRRTPRAFIQFVTAAAGTRYLKLTLDCWKLPEMVRLQMLGHELQHALEIAADPQVRDDRTLAALYRRIGHQVYPGQFETDAARAMERRVLDEVWVWARRKPEKGP